MYDPANFDQLAKNLNIMLAWARKKVTNKEDSTGAMQFVGSFRYEYGRLLRNYLAGMDLMREVEHRSSKPSIWWVDPDIVITAAMVEEEYYRQVAEQQKQLAATLNRDETSE